jgi:hypothetical protein
LIILAAALAPRPPHAQSATGDPIASWLARQREKSEARLLEDRRREARIEATLSRALDARAKAYALNDAAAKPVADQAVEKARAALEIAKSLTRRDETNLQTLDRAVAINLECAELRALAERDREALRRQVKASELVAEASASQPTLIAARSGMAAARFAILANQFTRYNKILMEAIQNFEYLSKHAAELGPVAVTRPKLNTMLDTWNGLNAVRTLDECGDQVKGWTSHSHTLEKGAAIGRCSEALVKTGEFVRFHGEVLEKVGRVFGVTVSALELANEIRELHEDLRGFAAHTRSHPEQALQAARRLDEQQRETLERITACQGRFVGVVRELR